MSNPTQPGKGGMPKWLIILLVVFLLIALGCCGGVGTCMYFGRKAVNKAREKAGTLQQQMEAEVAARKNLNATYRRFMSEDDPQRKGEAGKDLIRAVFGTDAIAEDTIL